MKLNNVRILVQDFDKCFEFYTQKLGLKSTWGEPGGEYASFDIGLPSGLSIFKSDLMAKALGNEELKLPENCREKVMINIMVDSVDRVYEQLKDKGVEFVNEPTDMTGWGMRALHLRDPEGNLIEFGSELPMDKWDNDLKEDAEKYKE